MSDYTVITDFAAKDALLTGNPAKAGKGTEISAELDAIAIAIASKVDETSGVLTTPQINDTSADHQYVFAVNELAADRTVTLPLLTGNDEFVFKDHAVTLTNKTVALGSNTVSGTKAQFDSACSDGNFLYVGDVTAPDVTQTNTVTLTNKTIAALTNNVEARSGPDASAFSFRNKIIGGDFTTNPWQRGTSFTSATTPANSDDTYLADRWYVLSDGNDIVDVTRSTDAPTGGIYSLAMDVETANKKFGIAQIIEYTNSAPLIGGTCTLSFKAKTSGASLTNIKAGVIAWSGTADTVTSDVISAWGADGVTPTLIANATFENTPSNLSVTGSWAKYTISGISVDTASTKNLIVFLWCDNATTTITDFMYVAEVQLEAGQTATPFETRPVGVELALCQRYLPAYTFGNNIGLTGQATSTTAGIVPVPFHTSARTAPTGISITGTIALTTAGNGNAGGTPAFSIATVDSCSISFSSASGLVAGNATSIYAAAGATVLFTGCEL